MIKINGEDLETIMQHYYAIRYLVEGIKNEDSKFKILSTWDEKRNDPLKHSLRIEIGLE